MSDFDTAQAQLLRARNEHDAARQAALQAGERQRRIDSAADRLARRFDANAAGDIEERRQLAVQARQAQEDLDLRRQDVVRARESLAAAIAEFATFSDPRRNLGELPDRSPFLLLPVRIETRFASVPATDGAAPAPQHQLWVRIYPDDCSIDTFESVLSSAEIDNAKRYWRAIFRAGGIEADKRAAWRGLVAAHGSGRAGWIADSYQPVDLAQKPVKAKATDMILVIDSDTPLAPSEAAAADAYWRAVWLAGDDRALQEAARKALDAAVGASRATVIVASYRPYNLADVPLAPLTRSDVALSTGIVIWPQGLPQKELAWAEVPRVTHFADRFVVLAYAGGVQVLEAVGNAITLPLVVGPDPSAPAADQIRPENGGLNVPDELRWLFDFDRAVQCGMGLRIDLTPEQARRGFDRVLVLGVELSASDADGAAALQTLLTHHHVGRSGISLLAQGTPTNNTTGTSSGFTSSDDADASFDARKNTSLVAPTTDPLRKRDGQWVAELLGIDASTFDEVQGTNGTDQIEARAMQRALWPATLGYWMDKMLLPIFDDDAVENTRWFFTDYVSGRGAVPALRIGSEPYGILPTTSFSRIRWLDEQAAAPAGALAAQRPYLARLLTLLRAVDVDWSAMVANVSYLGKPGDAHQILLDIVGLHPASVEFHSRYAESVTELFNIANVWGSGPDFWTTLQGFALQPPAMSLLARLGYAGTTEPDIVKHVFMNEAAALANVIDDRPLSDTNPIRAYTDDGRNYIEWLIAAANTSLDALRQEQGFSGERTPETILYLFLRHALMLGYYDASYNLYRSAAFLSASELKAMKPEPAFVHVGDAASSESRFAALYKSEPRITGDATRTVAEHIVRELHALGETHHLAEQMDALEMLKNAPTARLERVFAEHIDCCSYRFDAWLFGLANLHLHAMRYPPGDDGGTRVGVYLGAYAWVEDLRPSTATLTPVELSPELAQVFAGTTPLFRDSSNGGYIHAPSLPHAATAAVLRSGYLANATSANPGVMAVDLSSQRVRLALATLEGIRNGQSFGAILGYRFERGLHDAHGLAEVDKFIYPLRKAFPLASDRLATTKTDADVPIEAVEARNVLDGLKLVTRVRTGGNAAYPFGLTLPAANAAEAAAIDAEVGGLLEVYDAIADLALAEGVHQATQGNFDRVAATLEAYTTGAFPPEPAVVQTPVSGIGLTQRVALHLEADLASPPNATPRAIAEPALNAWIGNVLPPLNQLGCSVTWTDPVSGAAQQASVTLDKLGMQPLDLLELVKIGDDQAMTELDDRVLAFVIASATPRPDALLRIEYMRAPPGAYSVFEVAPLVRALRTLVSRSRPLRATDAMLHGDATSDADADVLVPRIRIANANTELDLLAGDFASYLSELEPLVADPAANRAPIVAGIDAFLDRAVALLERAARFALPLAGWGFVFDWRRAQFAGLMTATSELVQRWTARLAAYDAKILAYDTSPPPSDAARFSALEDAQGLVATLLLPRPPTPAKLRNDMDAKRSAFAARLAEFTTLSITADPSYPHLIASTRALLPIADFDAQTLDVQPFEDAALQIAADVAVNCRGHLTRIEARRTACQAGLAAHDAAASSSARVDALTSAAKALLGEDFRVIPEYALAAAQADEWANALNASTSGELLGYLQTTLAIDFPVDEWLQGAARVRPNLHTWEEVLVFAGAFGLSEPRLTPLQIPYEANAPWLALQYPPDYALDSDRLLYTACYAAPFDKTKRQCGLLLDEWTEVIPAKSRTTGLAFNFDRPNNEPPQTMLLVTPATANGAWQWGDLVGALNETLDVAKKRAVEPVHIDATTYARFLPATIMATALYGISITTTLAAANGVMRNLAASPNA